MKKEGSFTSEALSPSQSAIHNLPPENQSQFILRCEGLTKTFIDGELHVQVLRGEDFAVQPGELIAIMGASGSGKCILADEPTGNLDNRTTEHVFELLLTLNKELHTSFVIVTHDVKLASRMNRVLLLEDGKLVALHQ